MRDKPLSSRTKSRSHLPKVSNECQHFLKPSPSKSKFLYSSGDRDIEQVTAGDHADRKQCPVFTVNSARNPLFLFPSGETGTKVTARIRGARGKNDKKLHKLTHEHESTVEPRAQNTETVREVEPQIEPVVVYSSGNREAEQTARDRRGSLESVQKPSANSVKTNPATRKMRRKSSPRLREFLLPRFFRIHRAPSPSAPAAPSASFLFAFSAEAVRKEASRPPCQGRLAWPGSAPPSTGQRATVDPRGAATSGRGAGRVPCGGVFCPRGASCAPPPSALPPLPSGAVRCGGEPWHTAAATLSCSCRHHELWCRSRRRHALGVPPSALRAAITTRLPRSGSHKTTVSSRHRATRASAERLCGGCGGCGSDLCLT